MAVDLKDATARDRIVADLDRNLLVQAGAGAGKTHALIGRMVEVVGTGREQVQHMAAITFTKKAAGEMRARFHAGLRSALSRAPGSSPEQSRLLYAIDHVDQCYIGTIHAFCAKLLRERPLELGLPPGFSEMEMRGEWVSLREAWDAFVLDRYGAQDPRLDLFDSWGIRTDEFFDFFRRRSQFTELDLHWAEVPPADLMEPARIAADWVESVSAWIPDPLEERPDRLQEALLKTSHFLRNRGLQEERDARYLLSQLDLHSGSVVLKRWSPHQDKARELRDTGLPELVETTVRPALTRWRRAIYPEVAAFIDEAVESHRLRRFRAGTLTFQDLLEQAAQLLAENSRVRADLQNRYRSLFVDEFQDTDPLQAEILLYLTSEDPGVSDWRDCRPKPGSLFLVGDEKQAIYRFRRADLDVFRYVRDRVRSSGGDVLHLNTNFRSLTGICDWVNGAFEPIFGGFDPRYQATFAPLEPYREPQDETPSIMQITIDKVGGNDRTTIARQDANRIARYIAASIAGDDTISGAALSGPVSPADFMILTRTTGRLDTYAHALEALDIPFSIEGSGKLRESEELHDLIRLMECVLSPTNPIPLIAYLRGRFVGLGDDELAAFRSAGGQFDFRSDLPEDLQEQTATRFWHAFDILLAADRALQTEPVSVAFDRILEKLGTLPYATLRPMGSSRAGNLIRLGAIIRRWERAGWNWTESLQELQDLRDDPEYKLEEMTLDSGGGTSVRLMNLHQAKGLQARCVFLADPYDTSYERHDPDFHVSRSGSEPRLTLPVYRATGAHGKELISEPHGWDQDEEEEARFLDAEERRLVYVAATRAEDILVVSKYAGNTEKGPWSELYPFLEGHAELPDPDIQVPSRASTEMPDFGAVEQDLKDRWTRARLRSYGTATITGEDERDVRRSDEEPVLGLGIEYGQLVHDVFERAIGGVLPDDASTYIETLFAREDQSENAQYALESLERFRSSELWSELQESRYVHTEVDFARAEDFMGQTQVTRGRVDLVYRVVGGWRIVDFKTDRTHSEAETQHLRSRYGDQVRAYAKHWTELSGERVRSAGLWATDPGVWIEI